VANAPKVYDFPIAKVEDQLVSYLKKRKSASTVADMIAGTGLPKYQVEQAAKVVLDEYAGRLKVTESGELLYYFPAGMHNTTRGLGPSLRRFWKGFTRVSARVLTLAFKVWIVAMLVGYFIAFVAIGLLAIVASFAASAASKGEGQGGGGGRGGGFNGMYLGMRLLDLILRMWFWTSIFDDQRRGGVRRAQKAKEGRAFYKSVFGFVFGEDDPNKGWEEAERRHIISYIRGHQGVITREELMALVGREGAEADALMNRLLREYEGEPGVTEDGTVIYSFPALMRTAESARAAGQAGLLNPAMKQLVPFSANQKKTNGWIVFFNVFNLGFGSYFLANGLSGASLNPKVGPFLYAFTGSLMAKFLGIADPALLLAIGLGAVPVVFSLLFFVVPLVRKLRLDRKNAEIRQETLRRRVLSHVLAFPSHVDSRDITPMGTRLDPRNFPAACKRILEKIAAALGAEPIPMEKEGEFAYRFKELEREQADLQAFRAGIDPSKYNLGKTVYDSGK
jgi:hypothetical protein